MRDPANILTVILRLVGVLDMMAALAVPLPESVMSTAHQALGMGELPEAPLVGYLARTASGLYAMNGAVLLFVSRDVRRYAELIRYMASIAFAFGALTLGVDILEGMPLWWTIIEGPSIMAMTGVVFWLASRVAGGSQ